jgi:hypothetical protein
MPLIANNFIVGGKVINKEESENTPPDHVLETKEPIRPKLQVPLKSIEPSFAKKKTDDRFKKEHEQGILLGVNHSAYLNDMISIDKE